MVGEFVSDSHSDTDHRNTVFRLMSLTGRFQLTSVSNRSPAHVRFSVSFFPRSGFKPDCSVSDAGSFIVAGGRD